MSNLLTYKSPIYLEVVNTQFAWKGVLVLNLQLAWKGREGRDDLSKNKKA
jgi:hypothetical protein